MMNLLLTVAALGISTAFYPFLILGAFKMMATRRPWRNLGLLLAIYNVPLFLLGYLGLVLWGQLSFLHNARLWAAVDFAFAAILFLGVLIIIVSRHQAIGEHKPARAAVTHLANSPLAVGLFVLFLNPSAAILIFAGLSTIDHAPVAWWAKLFAVITLLIATNSMTFAAVLLYISRPRTARKWLTRIQLWITVHSWQLATFILLMLAAIAIYNGSVALKS